MVLTVLLEDVDWDLLEKGIPTNTWSTGKPVFDLEYLDVTFLMGKTATQLRGFSRKWRSKPNCTACNSITLKLKSSMIPEDCIPESCSRMARPS